MRHSGDEFILVVEGEIEVFTEFYEPIILRTGESLYLDSSMGHAYIARGKGPCRIIGICSASEQDLREATKADIREPASRRPRSTTKSKRGPRSRSS